MVTTIFRRMRRAPSLPRWNMAPPAAEPPIVTVAAVDELPDPETATMAVLGFS